MNVDGFPQTTFQLEQRQLNPFNDVNSFGATSRSNRRPLDTKGELGARPVQQWKEMLREGMQYRRAHTWSVPDFEPWLPGSIDDPDNPLHRFLDHKAIQETRQRTMASADRRERIAARGRARSSSTPRGGSGSARGKSSTPRGRRSASAGRVRPGEGEARAIPQDGSSPFLRSAQRAGGGEIIPRARSASPRGRAGEHGTPPGRHRPRFVKVDSGPFGTFGDGSRSAIAVQLPPSALPPQRRTQAPLAQKAATPGSAETQFGFWGGRSPNQRSQSPGRSPAAAAAAPSGAATTTVLATTVAAAPGATSARSASADGRRAAPARTLPSRALIVHQAAQDHALVLARARGRSPTRFGPAGERRLSVADRPGWRPVTGFPDNTVLTEHRKLNPFADINSYAARQGLVGARPLDCKGMSGARPLQQWKEMLRNGSA